MDPITSFQELIRARVASDTFITGVTVISETTGDVESTIDSKLKDDGLVCVVLAPELTKGSLPRSYRVDIEITFLELVEKNQDDGTGIACLGAAVSAFDRLSNWQSTDETAVRVEMESIELLSIAPLLIYQCKGFTEFLTQPTN